MWPSMKHDFGRSLCWYWMFLLMCCWALLEVVAGASQVESIARATIPVDPAAAKVFPSAQFSPACGIISIEGLGPLDGDYTLVDELTEINGIPAWISTSEGTHYLLLSWQMDERVWTIGEYGLGVFLAFVEGAPDLPPSRSSRWQRYVPQSVSVFEEVENVVSVACPACAAVAISMLPGTLATCEGSYRLRTANNNAGILSWSHVSDERCRMLHDNAGHSLVSLASSPISIDGSCTAYGFPHDEGWLLHSTKYGVVAPTGDGAKVACISAGRTTRLVFDLVKSREDTDSPRAYYDSSDAEAFVPLSYNVRLVSPQDGSIISASHSNIHVRITRDTELRKRDDLEIDVSDAPLLDENACGSTLCVMLTVDGVEWMTTSLERMSTQGGLQSLRGLEGTNVFEVCLFGHGPGEADESRPAVRQGCIARATLLLEMFSAERQMVQRRSLSETTLKPSFMSSGIGVDEPSGEDTRVVFVVDLGVVDGFKLSTLHLVKHLPDTFRVSTLDLSCATGDLPFSDILTKEVGEAARICIRLPKEAWDTAERESGAMSYFLYSILLNATTWDDVVSDYPDVARSLGKLYHHLTLFDALVMSNGGLDNDAYLLHLARLAGVKTRMVNLGAIAGGYMSPWFSAATSLVGPSHYVAHNPAVTVNAGGLPVKVCHPVMDAARVLKAARSCGSNGGGLNPIMGPTRGTNNALWFPQATQAGSGDSLQPARFIMVGNLATCKTPGMFVRAMAALQRRRWADGTQGRRMTQGVIVGSGPLRGHMETLARDLNATISFKGFLSVDDVPCEVQRATALVVPSISADTFGMVGPESMLLGVPLVTFGFGGTGELVRHMENGMVVAEPTPRALADALEILASDSGLRDRLGVQARLDATRALSLPEMVACHADELRI